MNGSPISEYGYPLPYGARRVRTSVGGLGAALIVLLALDAALAALAAGFQIWRFSLLGRPSYLLGGDPDPLHGSDRLAEDTVGWLTLVAIATMAVFIEWLWAARNNAEAYAPNRGDLGVGWSIGGWFIPGANFAFPFVVARDIYRGTMAGRQVRPQGGGAITGWWWAAYLTTSLMGLVCAIENDSAQMMAGMDGDEGLVRKAVAFDAAALIMVAVTALLAIGYVRTITKTQNARNREGDWYGGPGAGVLAGP